MANQLWSERNGHKIIAIALFELLYIKHCLLNIMCCIFWFVHFFLHYWAQWSLNAHAMLFTVYVHDSCAHVHQLKSMCHLPSLHFVNHFRKTVLVNLIVKAYFHFFPPLFLSGYHLTWKCSHYTVAKKVHGAVITPMLLF